jgi:hypothetical protein
MRAITCHEILLPFKDELIEEEVKELKTLHAPNYEEIGVDLLHARAVRLVEEFLASLQEEPSHFVKYLDRIARERFTEGYFLEEIQSALNILGEKAWAIAVYEAPLWRRDVVLSVISGTLGAAKDQLARVYMELLKSAEGRARGLERKLSLLLSGTVPAPELDDQDLRMDAGD